MIGIKTKFDKEDNPGLVNDDFYYMSLEDEKEDENREEELEGEEEE
jgi:hypothetical protein